MRDQKALQAKILDRSEGEIIKPSWQYPRAFPIFRQSLGSSDFASIPSGPCYDSLPGFCRNRLLSHSSIWINLTCLPDMEKYSQFRDRGWHFPDNPSMQP